MSMRQPFAIGVSRSLRPDRDFGMSATARALTLTVIVWGLAVSRWLAAGLTIPWDAKNQFYAYFRFLAASLHAGESPFWNPYHYGGHPALADPQSLILAPAFLAWAAIDPTPSMQAFDLIVLAHLLVGGLAVTMLGLRRDWPESACVLAAALFMLGGSASGRLNHIGIICCYALLPLAMLLLETALERLSLPLTLAFSIVAAQIVLARNQVALLLALTLAALAVQHVLQRHATPRVVRHRILLLALAAGAIAVQCAIPLLLTLQFAQGSNRSMIGLSEALQASLHPSALLTLAAPNAFGAHLADYAYWGPSGHVIPETRALDDSFSYIFFGAVPVLLLLWLGIACGRLLRPGARTWTMLLLAALAFSLGRYTPLFALVFDHVPGFKLFRRPVDGLFVVGAMIALLSGHLLADYVDRGLSRHSRFSGAATAMIAISLAACGLEVAQRTGHTIDTAIELVRALAILGLCAAFLWLGNRYGRRPLAATVVTIAAIGELLVWNAASRLNGEGPEYYSVLEHPSGEPAQALRVLDAEIARRHADQAYPRVEVLGGGGAWQNLGMTRGIEVTTGYNPLRIAAYDRLVQPGEASADATARRFPKTFSGYDSPLARSLGIEYVVVDRPLASLAHVPSPGGAELVRAGPSIWIYRLPGAMPRVQFHSRVVVADTDALDPIGRLMFPPQPDRVLVDDETPAHPIFRLPIERGRLGEARLRERRNDRLVIDVVAATKGVVVVHDLDYPGWIASIDGKRTRLLRADTLFRAVEVDAGIHEIILEFCPLRPENLLQAFAQVMEGGPGRAAARFTPPPW